MALRELHVGAFYELLKDTEFDKAGTILQVIRHEWNSKGAHLAIVVGEDRHHYIIDASFLGRMINGVSWTPPEVAEKENTQNSTPDDEVSRILNMTANKYGKRGDWSEHEQLCLIQLQQMEMLAIIARRQNFILGELEEIRQELTKRKD